jgi:hypothetical protein
MLTLAAAVLGRPVAPLVVFALAMALLAMVWLLVAALLGVDPNAVDDVGSWRWLPEA